MNGPSTASNAGAGTQKVTNNASSNGTTRAVNGDAHPTPTSRGKKSAAPVIDPSEVQEMVQNRIAALEGERLQGGEEDKRSAEEARKTLKGMTLQQLNAKYVELYQDFKRQEREHTKEKQKNKKEADASKTALTNVQKLKSKTDAVVRDMQKQNKDLREEAKRLKSSLHQVEVQLSTAKEELQRRVEGDKKKEKRHADMPDIVIKVVCRYRAELFFKISRKTKLARLFHAWTDRMEARSYVHPMPDLKAQSGDMLPKINAPMGPPMQFCFTHRGRPLDNENTPEDAGMEDGDEILAVEMMDLTGPEVDEVPKQEKLRLQKNWSLDPVEARTSVEGIFDGVVRERLKDLLRQYELRETQFEAILRSKELELMIAKARGHETKAELEREVETLSSLQDQNQELMKKVEEMQASREDLFYQFELYTAEFLSAVRAEGKDYQESMERALQVFESLRHQINQFDHENESISEPEQAVQDG